MGCPVKKKVFDAYVDTGGNFIDTANVYTGKEGGRTSEKYVGDFVSSDRDQFVIARLGLTAWDSLKASHSFRMVLLSKIFLNKGQIVGVGNATSTNDLIMALFADRDTYFT
jgi:hypothetical protein